MRTVRFALFAIAILLSGALAWGQGVITTVAGGNPWVFTGNRGPAINAPLGILTGIAVDSLGTIYAADNSNSLVVKITRDGALTIVGGGGQADPYSSNVPATSLPMAPNGVAVDATGNIYVADNFGLIRKISTAGIVTTVAGNGTSAFSGDGGPATSASLNSPAGVALDNAGNIYIADANNNRIRKINPSGIISTVAGNGTSAFSGDGGPAGSASLNNPTGVAVDPAGNVYIADAYNNRVRKVSAGIITTVAGGGQGGDGGPAASALINFVRGVTVDASGNLYIAAVNDSNVRKVNAGTISTVAGNGTAAYSGDGGLATAASLYYPYGVALDSSGNIYVADSNYSSGYIRQVSLTTGNITTLAGNGGYKFAGDLGPATGATLNHPGGVTVDASGNVYISDSYNNRIRKVGSSGIITTIAGNGLPNFSTGDPATSASLQQPAGVAVDAGGNLYVADRGNHRVRRVTNGSIFTAAGGGTGGDGVSATTAALNSPTAVAIDAAGNLYIADQYACRIRKVTNGIISTVAGTGDYGSSGDGGPAINAKLSNPSGVAVDSSGNIYISDYGNNRIRKVSPAGTITAFAGNGTSGYSGDGSPAVNAMLSNPQGVAVDVSGNVLIADGNGVVRKVTPAGIISTVAGGAPCCSPGDGGLAKNAWLSSPSAVAIDATGNIFIADSDTDLVREVLAAAPSLAVSPTTLGLAATSGSPGGTQQITVVSNALGVAWTGQAQSTGAWLSVSPSGTAPGAADVSADASNLGPGTYQGTVTIKAPLAVPSSQTVSVQLVVSAVMPARLTLQPSSFNFQTPAGAAGVQVQTLQVGNAGSGILQWTAFATTTSGGSWLTISVPSGSASSASPSMIQITAGSGSLAAGTYSGQVTVRSQTTGETNNIPVTLLISSGTRTLLLSQTALLFTGVQGGTIVPPQNFSVLNTGQGVLNWNAVNVIYSGGNWLSSSPGTGSTDAASLQIPQITVGANTTGMTAGDYTGIVSVSGSSANNSPQIVTVKLHVLPPGSNPGVLVRPTGLVFAAAAGTSSPPPQTVTVATAASGANDFTAGSLTRTGGNWLNVSSRGEFSIGQPGSLVVQPVLGNLSPGVYQGTVALLFADGSAQTVGVTFLVIGAAGTGSSLSPEDTGCVPQKLFAADRSVGSSFSSPVGYPRTLEVYVADNCGNPSGNGTVIASFSNGDPPIVLVSLLNGIYTATWQPGTAAAQVVITETASSPGLASAVLQVSGQAPDSPSAPAISAGGVVNGASFAGGAPLAPGGIISLFGKNLAAGSASASQLPLTTALGGLSASVGGEDMPLFYSSSGQINAQLPVDLPTNSKLQVIVRTTAQGAASIATVPETINVGSAAPGIFTVLSSGKGDGVILHADNTLINAANPAKGGEEVVIYCTGLGPTTPSFPSGTPATAPNDTVNPVTVTIGGQNAVVVYKGLTAELVGLYQINAYIPAGLSGSQPIQVTVGQGNSSPAGVTISVVP